MGFAHLLRPLNAQSDVHAAEAETVEDKELHAPAPRVERGLVCHF